MTWDANEAQAWLIYNIVRSRLADAPPAERDVVAWKLIEFIAQNHAKPGIIRDRDPA